MSQYSIYMWSQIKISVSLWVSLWVSEFVSDLSNHWAVYEAKNNNNNKPGLSYAKWIKLSNWLIKLIKCLIKLIEMIKLLIK